MEKQAPLYYEHQSVPRCVPNLSHLLVYSQGRQPPALLNVGRQPGGSLGIAIMGTVAATIAKDQLAPAAFSPGAVNQAPTAGYSAAFVAAGLITIAGLVTVLVAVRPHREGTGRGSSSVLRPEGSVMVAEAEVAIAAVGAGRGVSQD